MPPSQKVLTTSHFRLSIPGVAIGSFRECNGLTMEFEVFEWAEGGNNEFVHHLPGRMRYPYLQFSAGMTDGAAPRVGERRRPSRAGAATSPWPASRGTAR